MTVFDAMKGLGYQVDPKRNNVFYNYGSTGVCKRMIVFDYELGEAGGCVLVNEPLYEIEQSRLIYGEMVLLKSDLKYLHQNGVKLI